MAIESTSTRGLRSALMSSEPSRAKKAIVDDVKARMLRGEMWGGERKGRGRGVSWRIPKMDMTYPGAAGKAWQGCGQRESEAAAVTEGHRLCRRPLPQHLLPS